MPVHRPGFFFVAVLALAACAREASAPLSPVANAPAAPAAAATAPSADAYLVLPGDYAQSTTVADFEARFGKANLEVVEVGQTDGSRRRHLVLFPADPTRRAEVRFHDQEAMTDLAGIHVSEPQSAWRGPRGVRVGMTLAELQAINGKPFYFSGFDDQGRAWVRDQWSPSLDDAEATLGRLDVGEGDRMYFGVDLGLRAEAKGAWPKDDSTLSNEANYPGLGQEVVVTAITAYTSLDDEWE